MEQREARNKASNGKKVAGNTVFVNNNFSSWSFLCLFFLLSITMSEGERSQTFFQRLEARVKEIDSHLCVGLDPHGAELKLSIDASESERCEAAFAFCKRIIDASGKIICDQRQAETRSIVVLV
jgi:hypothetical protein